MKKIEKKSVGGGETYENCEFFLDFYLPKERSEGRERPKGLDRIL